MALTLDQVRGLEGSTLVDRTGSKIGKIADIYIDQDTQRPEWALVHTGLFGGRESFVPLAEAELQGDQLRVPYAKDQVKDAPNAEPDGELSQEEELRLYQHYGLQYSEARSDSGLPTGTAGMAAATTGTTGYETAGRGTVGHDTSGPTTDDAMTRSEERLRVGVVRRPSQTVRLKKYIVTENVTTTVPLVKERATVVREPITEANRDAALAGPDLSEEEHEVVLREERPVVEKETVPVERIRLAKDVVTEQQTVTGEVRKEQIEVDDPTRTDRR